MRPEAPVAKTSFRPILVSILVASMASVSAVAPSPANEPPQPQSPSTAAIVEAHARKISALLQRFEDPGDDVVGFMKECLDTAREADADGAHVEEFIELCDRTASLARANGKPGLASNVALVKSRYHRVQGDLATAQAILEKAIRGTTTTPRTHLQTELAELLRLQGDWHEALEVLERAHVQLEPLHAPYGATATRLEAGIHSGRCRLAMAMGSLDSAAVWLARQKAALESIGQDAHRNPSYVANEIRLLHAARDFESALAAIEDAIARGASTHGEITASQLELYRADAVLRIEEGRPTAATTSPQRDAVAEAMQALRNAITPDLAPEVVIAPLLRLSWRYAVRGDVDIAIELQERARTVLSDIPRTQKATHSTILATGEAVDLHATIHRTVLLHAVAARILRARAHAAVDDDATKALASEAEALLAEYRPSFTRLIRSWARSPRLDAGTGFLEYSDRRRMVGELVSLILHLDDTPAGVEQAWRVLLEAQTCGSLARSLHHGPEDFDATSVDLSTVRDLLVPGEGMILYLFAPERSHAFLLDDTTLEYVALEHDDATLQGWRDRVCDALTARGSAEDDSEREQRATRIEPVRKSLQEALVPPALAKRLSRPGGSRWRYLTVIGDDQLHWIPMEVLVPRGLPLAYLPSIPVGLGLLPRRPQGKPERLAYVCALEGVREPWTSSYRTTALDDLAADALAGQDLLHVTAHGRYDELGNVRMQVPDRTLGEAEVKRLAPVPLLVVLAVCSGGGGPASRGDPRAALAGAFLEVGACTVIASPLDVYVPPALELMERLHAGLGRGKSPSEALAIAGDGIREPHVVRAHRTFRVVGLGHRR